MTTIVSTQYLLPQAVIANGAVTGTPWSNPNNILLVDGDVTASDPSETASDITIGNFLANLPQNAIITGLEFQLIARRGAQTSPVITLTPYLFDNTNGAEDYYPYITPITTDLTPDLTPIIFGGPNYLFASSFTPDQINNAKLNFIANGDISIDSCLMKVYYYISDTPTPPTPTGPNCIDCNSPIQAQPFYLAEPFKAGDRFAYFQSFNYPDGTPINFADLGSCGGIIKFVFDPGVPKIENSDFEENLQSGVWEILTNGQVKFDFGDINVNRGLMFHTPYTADPNLRSNHGVQAKIIISDSGPFLGQYLQKCQVGTVFSAPIEVYKDGSLVLKPVTKFNLKGAGVTVVENGTDDTEVDITIPGSGGTTPPVIVGIGSGTSGNTPVSSLTYNVPISGLNRGCAIEISTEQLVTVASVTVGGVAAAVHVSRTDTPNNLRSQIWFVVAPPLGVQPVVITLSAPAYISSGAEAMAGVDAATPIGTTQNAAGTSLAPSLSLTTTYDNSTILDSLTTAHTPILYTPGAGQAASWSHTTNTDTRQGGSSSEAAGLQPDVITMQYSITQNTPWVYTALEVKGVTSTPPSSGITSINADTTPAQTIVPGSGISVSTAAGITTITNTGAIAGAYHVDQTPLGTGSTYPLIAGAINGSNALFTVFAGVYTTGKLLVSLNGTLLAQGSNADWVETSPGAGTFTLNTPPITGDIITVQYI